MKYGFIERSSRDYPITVLCKTMGVSKSGYYDWIEKGSIEDQGKKILLDKIKEIFDDSRGAYGAPRMHKKLREEGFHVSKGKVEKLMRENGIKAKRKRKFKTTTDSKHNLPVAKNRLKRKFKTKKPNQVWVSDITYVWTDEGWLYLSVFIDLYSRAVLGWSMSSRINKDLVLDAFRMAKMRRGNKAPKMVHSDRGSQYASDLFRAELKRDHCKQSMSRKGDCWDNAVAESFFGSLKEELIHHMRFKTRQEAINQIFDYIEVFYNRQRLHSYLNYLSPLNFEKTFSRAA